MIKIYGPARTSAGRCIWALEEAGLKYENVNVDLRSRENKSENFLAINPNGKVPALVDGDFTLFESMAINFYIADKYAPALLGTDANERALSHQWSFWASTELQPSIIEVFIQKVFMPEEKRSQAIIETHMNKIPGMLDILEKALENKTYLNNKSFSLADLNTASVVSIAQHIGVKMDGYKNINQWLAMMNERPAYQKYIALRNAH